MSTRRSVVQHPKNESLSTVQQDFFLENGIPYLRQPNAALGTRAVRVPAERHERPSPAKLARASAFVGIQLPMESYEVLFGAIDGSN